MAFEIVDLGDAVCAGIEAKGLKRRAPRVAKRGRRERFRDPARLSGVVGVDDVPRAGETLEDVEPLSGQDPRVYRERGHTICTWPATTCVSLFERDRSNRRPMP